MCQSSAIISTSQSHRRLCVVPHMDSTVASVIAGVIAALALILAEKG